MQALSRVALASAAHSTRPISVPAHSIPASAAAPSVAAGGVTRSALSSSSSSSSALSPSALSPSSPAALPVWSTARAAAAAAAFRRPPSPPSSFSVLSARRVASLPPALFADHRNTLAEAVYATPRRAYASAAASGGADASVLVRKLRERFGDPPATSIEVEDVSGGCGAFFRIHVEAPEFAKLGLLQQHRAVKEALSVELPSMHGVTLSTRAPPPQASSKQ